MKITAQFGMIIALVASFIFILICLIYRLCILKSRLKNFDNMATLENGKDVKKPSAPINSKEYEKSVI